jgi:UPF0755 protein
MARRLGALAALLAVVGIGVWAATSAIGGDAKPKPLPTNPTLRIVFPEGFTREQMARRITAVDAIARRKRHVDPILSASGYLAATKRVRAPVEFAKDVPNRAPEGFLFPALYEFTAQTTSRSLAKDQLVAFRRNWRKVNLAYAKSRNLTPYDVLIIASIIEREALAPGDQKLVAAVIYNRLRAAMSLGLDATVRYGLDIPPGKPLTDAQANGSNPYNTRTNHGLPPTPISNPGLAAMQAAAHPAKANYLYFYLKPDKVHLFFTASLDAFNAYKAAHPAE